MTQKSVGPIRPHAASTEHTEIVQSFVRAGAAWARYGLGVARMSIEASAQTLDATAEALGAISDRLRNTQESDRDDRAA